MPEQFKKNKSLWFNAAAILLSVIALVYEHGTIVNIALSLSIIITNVAGFSLPYKKASVMIEIMNGGNKL